MMLGIVTFHSVGQHSLNRCQQVLLHWRIPFVQSANLHALNADQFLNMATAFHV